MKRLNKTGYKYVYEVQQSGGPNRFQAKLPNQAWGAMFETAREAGLSVDRALIKLNKEPVNILKRA